MRNRVELPESFLQYGLPRTATTLQFITIQACLCALNHTSAKVQKSHNLAASGDTGALVRGYGPAWRDAVRANNTTAVFVTSTEGQSKRDPFVLTGHDSTRTHEPWQVEARALENAWDIPHRSIWYVQSVAAVARRDWKIIEDYREIFDLDKEEYGAVVQFMRLWDVLRRCCGPQMSLDYRMRLYGKKNYAPHLTSESVAWDACEMYDIDQVELQFMRSTLVNRCNGRPIDGGRPRSTINLEDSLQARLLWSKVNGTFCSSYKNAAINEKLKFNQRPQGWPVN